ncbi:hypothetical protein Tco_1562606 [Tanacetum coccineum]
MDDLSNKSETNSENSLTIFEVRSTDEESTLSNNRFTKANEYHDVPLPITGNPLTPRPDISFAGLDDTGHLIKDYDFYDQKSPEPRVRNVSILGRDATRIHNLSDAEIYAGLATLGYATEGAAMDQGEGSAQPAEPQHTPVDPITSTSQPPHPSPP